MHQSVKEADNYHIRKKTCTKRERERAGVALNLQKRASRPHNGAIEPIRRSNDPESEAAFDATYIRLMGWEGEGSKGYIEEFDSCSFEFPFFCSFPDPVE